MKNILLTFCFFILFCTANTKIDDKLKLETAPANPIVKTMVRFSKTGLASVINDNYIKILKIDSVHGITDTAYYIDYIEAPVPQ